MFVQLIIGIITLPLPTQHLFLRAIFNLLQFYQSCLKNRTHWFEFLFNFPLPSCSKILTWLTVGALRPKRNKKDLCHLEVHFQVHEWQRIHFIQNFKLKTAHYLLRKKTSWFFYVTEILNYITQNKQAQSLPSKNLSKSAYWNFEAS